MARPWRIQYPDAVYHVMARGNAGCDIFLDDADRRVFLKMIATFAARFNVQIFAFCLMSNHYHLFLRTREANLATAMHWLNSTYTNWFNKSKNRYGHLTQGRYKSVLVTDEGHWLSLSAYIHLNPVRAGTTDGPGQYEWSSYRDYVRQKTRYDWLDTAPILAPYGPDDQSRKRNYKRGIVKLSRKNPGFWDDIRRAVFLGAEETWEKLKRDHPPKGKVTGVPDFLAARESAVDFEEELARVAEVFETTPEEILANRGRNFARSALFYHLVERCGLTGVRVADLVGVSGQAVSKGTKKIAEKMEKDEDIRIKMENIRFKIEA